MTQFEQDMQMYNAYVSRNKLMGISIRDEFYIDTYRQTITLVHAYPNKDGVYVIPPFVSSIIDSLSIQHTLFPQDIKDLTVINKHNRIPKMNNMFSWYPDLRRLDLSNFDTTGVLEMKYMFLNAVAIKELDLRSFNTSTTIDMSHMFEGCKSLERVDLQSFDTRVLRFMTNMFMHCSALKHLDLHNFNTTALHSAFNLCDFCTSLETVDLSLFSLHNGLRLIPNSTQLSTYFAECYKLKYVIIEDKDTREVIRQSVLNYNSGTEYQTALQLVKHSISDVKFLASNSQLLFDVLLKQYKLSAVAMSKVLGWQKDRYSKYMLMSEIADEVTMQHLGTIKDNPLLFQKLLLKNKTKITQKQFEVSMKAVQHLLSEAQGYKGV